MKQTKDYPCWDEACLRCDATMKNKEEFENAYFAAYFACINIYIREATEWIIRLIETESTSCYGRHHKKGALYLAKKQFTTFWEQRKLFHKRICSIVQNRVDYEWQHRRAVLEACRQVRKVILVDRNLYRRKILRYLLKRIKRNPVDCKNCRKRIPAT